MADVRFAHFALWLVTAACLPAQEPAGTTFAEAMRRYERVLADHPHDEAARTGERDAAIGWALQFRRGGNDPEALRCLERARAVLPDDPVILTDLGVLADVLHHYDEAAGALEAALALEPNNATAQYALARTNVDRSRPKEAEPLFHAYLAQRPNDATAHYGLGRLLQLEERSEEATAEFNRSIALQPVQTEAYFQRGQMALDAGRDDEARNFFSKTLSRMPTHGGALTGKGILDYRRKEYASARKVLEAATASSPDFATAHYYLGLTLGRMGDKEGSRRELGIATELTTKQQDKSQPVGVDGYPAQVP